MPIDSQTDFNDVCGDELVQWTITAHGTAIEGTPGPLLKPSEHYKCALVPSYLAKDPTLAIATGHLGKASPNERTELSVIFHAVKPLHSYHVGYCEWGQWHWHLMHVPAVVRLLHTTDSRCSALVDFSHHPAVVQLHTALTCTTIDGAKRTEERSYDIDELLMDEEESIHLITFRNLRTATMYQLVVTPVFAEDPEGIPVARRLRRLAQQRQRDEEEEEESVNSDAALTDTQNFTHADEQEGEALLRHQTFGDPTRSLWSPRNPNEPAALAFLQSRIRLPSVAHRFVTQPDVMVAMQDIGDTYIRLVLRRPLLRLPLGHGVTTADADITEYIVQLWEDPREALERNAMRLSRGRRPQKYALRRAEVRGVQLPCGHYETILIDRLTPNRNHFLVVRTKSKAMLRFDPRDKRMVFRTREELEMTSFALSSTSARLAWRRPLLADIGACHIDVDFPTMVDSFSTADEPRAKPYIGPNVVELSGGNFWSPPTFLQQALDPQKKSGEEAQAYDVHIRDMDTGEVQLLHVSPKQGCEALVRNLRPSACLMLMLRVAVMPLQPSRSAPYSPWSRPYLFMTPSDLLSQVVARSASSLHVAWGTHHPAVVHRLDYLPGRQKYLPYMYVQRDQLEADAKAIEQAGGRSSHRSAAITGPPPLKGSHSQQFVHPYEHYFYLEPLPYLCGQAVQDAELSESDTELEVYADDSVLGSGSGYLGKRTRIVNRAPRPSPVPFAARKDPTCSDALQSIRMCVFQVVPAAEPFTVPTVPATATKDENNSLSSSTIAPTTIMPSSHAPHELFVPVAARPSHETDGEGPLGPESTVTLEQSTNQRETRATWIRPASHPIPSDEANPGGPSSSSSVQQQVRRYPVLVARAMCDLAQPSSRFAKAVAWCRQNPYAESDILQSLENVSFPISAATLSASAPPGGSVVTSSRDAPPSATTQKKLLHRELSGSAFLPVLSQQNMDGSVATSQDGDSTCSSGGASSDFFALKLLAEEQSDLSHGTIELSRLPSDTTLVVALFATYETRPAHPRVKGDEEEAEDVRTVEKLVNLFTAFTLPETTTLMSPSMDRQTHAALSCTNQQLWSSSLFDRLYGEERCAELSIVEVSEVYVTLRLDRTAASFETSHRLSLLHRNQKEWESDDGEGDENLDEEEDDGSDAADTVEEEDDEVEGEAGSSSEEAIPQPTREYLLRVEQIELIDGVRHVIGDTRVVYVAAQTPTFQLVNLTAASRYEVSVSTISAITHTWTPFSAPTAFVTVQKLLLELEEMSSEYVSLRWARSGRVDHNVSYFALHLLDAYEVQEESKRLRGAVSTASYYRGSSKAFGFGSIRSSRSAFIKGQQQQQQGDQKAGAQQGKAASMTFPPSEAVTTSNVISCAKYATVVESVDMKHRIVLHGNHALLRSASMYDCMVAPHYDNGERGLFSNVLRFVHCTVRGAVEETGVAHIRVGWDRLDFSKIIPPCLLAKAGGSLTDATITRQCVCIVRLRDKNGSWERTRQVNPEQSCVCIFDDLTPETDHVLDVSFVALVPRCTCCSVQNVKEVLDCAEPFHIEGRTLRKPDAWVSQVGEDAMEIAWSFEAEAEHEGPVSLGVRFSDTRNSSNVTETVVQCPAMGANGTGTYLFQGLAPQRTYQCSIRQQYSKGTWGQWQQVFEKVPTLPALKLTLVSASETFFCVRVHREELRFHEYKGMERAVAICPARYRFTATAIQPTGGGGQQALMTTVSTANFASPKTGAVDLLASTFGSTTGAGLDLPSATSVAGFGSWIEPLLTETTTPNSVLHKLLPNTPYSLIAQQWSVDDWGAPSAEVCSYTLRSMVPSVLRRCDSYLDIQCARDRRLPAVATSKCSPHSELTSMKLSRLVGVHLNAKSLLNEVLASKVFVPCTEGTCATIPARLSGFDAAHPYRIDVRPQYEDDLFCPVVTSLATITMPLPGITVSTLAEDFVTLSLDRNAVPAALTQAHEAFQGLPPAVRHAANEGAPIEVTSYEFSFEGLLFDEYERPEDRPRTFLSGELREGVTVDAKALALTKKGLVHDMRYSVSLATHSGEIVGKMHEIGTFETRAFPVITVNKLAENFAEITWEPKKEIGGGEHGDLDDGDRAATTVGGAIQKRFGQANRIPPSVNYNLKDNGNQGDEFEYALIENITDESKWRQLISAPPPVPALADPTTTEKNQDDLAQSLSIVATLEQQPNSPSSAMGAAALPISSAEIVTYLEGSSLTRRLSVSYQSLCALVESLVPETPYVVFGRVSRNVRNADGSHTRICSAWGPPTVFSTLALLVLRIVHCSLDFVNVAWQDPSHLSSPTRRIGTGPVTEGTVGKLPMELWGSSMAFTKGQTTADASGGSLTGSAQPVRFQMRCMHATPDGACGDVLEDMYVTTTEDGIHTVRHLTPGTAYALSMRVCYESLTGSWVAPAAFRTDAFPEPKILSVTRNDIELLLDLHPGVELRGDEDKAVPIRTNRLYEVMVNDDEVNIKSLLVSTLEPYRLYLPGLKRGTRYRTAIRERIAGQAYGSFCHLSSFWVQPYPPVMVRLLECREGFCHMQWTVIERKSALDQQREDAVDFVYQLEQGVRVVPPPNDTTSSRALVTVHNPLLASSSNNTEGKAAATTVIEGIEWREVVITDVPQHRFRWYDHVPSDRNAQTMQFNELCFRVRASKCFVKQDEHLPYKTPVWGDWSLVAAWDNAVPPKAVQHLKLSYCSDTSAQVQWQPPVGHEVHPQLTYSVRISFEANPGAEGSATGGDAAETLDDVVGTNGGPATGTISTAGSGWHYVGNTEQCWYEVTGLAKATAYRIAVTAESSFGVSRRAAIMSFTSRSIPNPERCPPVVQRKVLAINPLAVTANSIAHTYMDPVSYQLMPGLRPIDANSTVTGNLYDKYDQPRQLRRRALARMAGLLEKTAHQKNIRNQFRGTIRRIIFIQRVIVADAVAYMHRAKFKPNEVYTPEQVARLRFGQNAESSAVIWTEEVEQYFQQHLREYLAGNVPFGMSPLRWLGNESLFLPKEEPPHQRSVALRSAASSRPNSVRSTNSAQKSREDRHPHQQRAARNNAASTAPLRNDEDDVSWTVPQTAAATTTAAATRRASSDRRLVPLPEHAQRKQQKGTRLASLASGPNNTNHSRTQPSPTSAKSGEHTAAVPRVQLQPILAATGSQSQQQQQQPLLLQNLTAHSSSSSHDLVTTTNAADPLSQEDSSPLLSATALYRAKAGGHNAAPVSSSAVTSFLSQPSHTKHRRGSNEEPHGSLLPQLPLRSVQSSNSSKSLLLAAPSNNNTRAMKSPHRSPNTQNAPSTFNPHAMARVVAALQQQQQQQPMASPKGGGATQRQIQSMAGGGRGAATTGDGSLGSARRSAASAATSFEAIASMMLPVVDPPPLLPPLLRKKFEK